ncbi:MAG: DUF1565 domain-containing protein [Stigonema ocellatum SAG 48.90 = DSM 106950]|nr:DUF1565 domain-containing protein [Stigonema ocellatum SAG 48.90 = DSM 106950]
MVNSTLVATLYVNPVVGNDANTGSPLDPYKTLTRALRGTTTTATIIQLASGTYSTASGEVFPLVIPAGVMVVGNEATKGEGLVISGSGEYQSQSFGVQNITLLLLSDAQLMGVTVTNATAKGTGVWIESTAPILANNTFINCGREGVFVTGTAKPAIVDNMFVQNSAGGLVMARNSKGEVLRNVWHKNALGIAISDFAAPMVANNKLSENRIAIALSRDARPVLRNNIIQKNTQGGLLINGNALPDLGSTLESAGNIFRDNQQFDVKNDTLNRVVSSGNDLNIRQVLGLVELIAVTQDTPNLISVRSSFSDLTGHWATDFVEALLKKGLISGFGHDTFAPEAPMTRAEYAAVIASVFKLPPGNQTPDPWAASPIDRATSIGFLSGFSDGTFRAGQNLTKIEAIVSMVNGLKLSGGNPNVLTVYCDRAQIPSYATNAVAVATEKMLVVNYPQTEKLEPLRDITRAEVAVLIYQALVVSGKEKPIVCPYIVNSNFDVPGFTDLMGHWAEPFIRGLVSMNLTRGFADGSYQPNKPVTRAQYAALVASAFNKTAKRPAPDFIDVPKDYWAYSAIKMAAQSGFVGGKSDGTFRPEQNVLRVQVLVSLVNGLALPAAHPNAVLSYSDCHTIPDSVRKAVATATQQRIVVNYPDPKQIEPDREATRGEVAAMVYQALVATGQTPAISSPYVVFPFTTKNVY